jgi:DNA-binding NtrC family response regulator
MDLLVRYDYPGNVRELENIVQRCLVLARGDQITTDDLPSSVLGADDAAGYVDPGPDSSLPARVAALEKAAIEEALAAEDGNQTRAAKRLGISERALRYKLAKFRGPR